MGTSRAYACDKLARERPDLFSKVKTGEVSAHAAMVAAGFTLRPTPIEERDAALTPGDSPGHVPGFFMRR